MKRSVLLSIMFIAGTLGIIVFSAAQFTDFEVAPSSPIQAGTIDLVLTDQSTTSSAFCDFPGDGLEGAPLSGESRATCLFSLTQIGSLHLADLYAKLTIETFACQDPEGLEGGASTFTEHCDATDDLQPGQFTITQASLSPSIAPGFNSTSELGQYPLNCGLLITDMVPGTTYDATFEIELQQHRTTNAMQGDAIKLTFDFELAEDGAVGVDCVNDNPAP